MSLTATSRFWPPWLATNSMFLEMILARRRLIHRADRAYITSMSNCDVASPSHIPAVCSINRTCARQHTLHRMDRARMYLHWHVPRAATSSRRPKSSMWVWSSSPARVVVPTGRNPRPIASHPILWLVTRYAQGCARCRFCNEDHVRTRGRQ